VLAAVRDLNRLELAGESVRAALEAIAAVAPDWLGATIEVADWNRRYGTRVDSWRLPTSKTKREASAGAYGRDGFALLGGVYDQSAPAWLAELPAVDILRIVLLQNYVLTTDRAGREVVKMRDGERDGLPPGRSRLTSPYDPDARWGGKRDLSWNGYKLHISETCNAEPVKPGQLPTDPPNLITNVATTEASISDAAMTEPIHEDLARRGLLPAEHYVDSGYPSAELLISSLTRYGITLVTPMLSDTSPQARAGAGFDRTGFTIHWHNQQATCPQGQHSASWTPASQRAPT
jgi:hypothetical protein